MALLIMPYQFMIITVISIFTIIGVGLFAYLVLTPCPKFGNYFKNKKQQQRNWKRKTSCINGTNSFTTIDATNGKKVSNILQCPNGCCIGIPVPSSEFQNNNNNINNNNSNNCKDESLSVERPSTITGPQGHGFYTSGPWKIDTMGPEAFGQFSNPEFLMTEYFASIMSPQGPNNEILEEPSFVDPDVESHCHTVGGSLMICDEASADDHSNDYALMDLSSQSDADMAMMIF